MLLMAVQSVASVFSGKKSEALGHTQRHLAMTCLANPQQSYQVTPRVVGGKGTGPGEKHCS